jgi:uncharacterized phage protein (TIGR01671 family)
MREIKFRAWDVWGKKIIDWREIYDNKPFNYDFHMGVTGNLIPLQYTGLKDKNRVEIYEGDIIGDKKSWSIVIWCDKCIGWQYAWYDFDLGEKICHMCKGDFDITETFENGISCDDEKVIGNIYETPELLAKDKPMI